MHQKCKTSLIIRGKTAIANRFYNLAIMIYTEFDWGRFFLGKTWGRFFIGVSIYGTTLALAE